MGRSSEIYDVRYQVSGGEGRGTKEEGRREKFLTLASGSNMLKWKYLWSSFARKRFDFPFLK
jgi:hypothetical protein